TSLNQRLSVFLLLPVALLLIAMGYAGFIYARSSLLEQWRETAILSLQQEAHQVDMSLNLPKQWIRMFYEVSGKNHGDHHIYDWILDRLRNAEGVERVNIIRLEDRSDRPSFRHKHFNSQAQDSHKMRMGDRKKKPMMIHHGKISEITPPRYDASVDHETVSMISTLHNESGHEIGKLEVVIRFDFLFENVRDSRLWHHHQAYLVDDTGKILYSPLNKGRKKLFENGDPLELQTIYAIRSMTYGTLFGEGDPPSKVSGFYKLREAPWNLVMIAAGEEILAPIQRFRLYYVLGAVFFIILILFLIRLVTSYTVTSITDISEAADRVARGDYGKPLPVKTQDEVGELARSFNSMVHQLEERMRLKEVLNLAMQVQQNLLPQRPPDIDGLDIAGKSSYCDETGGDYFDFLQFTELGQGRIGIAVGDVVGHGIAAALLMTTARALIRIRASQPGSISQKITDVNKHLYLDTSSSSSFMTLFFMVVDTVTKEIQWVRAGHEPAIAYEPFANSFEELRGDGMALGIDDNWSFTEYKRSQWSAGQIILIGTDGIWEAENPHGERFGKDRVRQILRLHAQRSSQEIVQRVIDAVVDFRQTTKPKDDITLVVIKFTS
ncbi:MAG: SpoIIE family protein phosphatase, partial [Desulfobacterales bacterium]